MGAVGGWLNNTVLDELSHLERRSIALGKCFCMSKSSGYQT